MPDILTREDSIYTKYLLKKRIKIGKHNNKKEIISWYLMI
ncbi:MAG: hypothetical protein QG646_1144 [Euryarchaeota archaeon]|nr:hypothetical protein [Euryarchaeota archaeon]